MTELLEQLIVRIQKESDINAPLDVTFAAILEHIGPGFEKYDGTKMPMVLEAFPGGRWYRDLGDNTGHFWGHVQVIKPPKLLEITGPLFMSAPVASHVQYRLTEQGAGTRLTILHRVIGEIDPDLRKGMNAGWEHILNAIKKKATR